MPDPRDEFTLLCERCGYVIEDLPREGPCPECGTPIAESLPERRPGSPWQRWPGLVSWWRTTGVLLSHPHSAWSDICIEPVRASFGRVNTWVSTLLIGSVAATRLARQQHYPRYGPPEAWPPISVVWFSAFIIIAPLTLLAIAVLSQIEASGIQFFGKRRGWRITPTAADAICGHASIGWLIGALLWGAGALAVDSGLVARVLTSVDFADPYISAWIRALLPASGFFVGLLIFEFLVYFGVRRNRFANRSRPGR